MRSMTEFANDRQFNRLCRGQGPVDFVELMLEFSADYYAELDRDACRREIDRLGQRAAARLRARCPDGELLHALQAIGDLLCREEGFHGNQQHYYDPRNSYLNEVLRRRQGIPISLAIVYREVAARAGVYTYGVAAPGHFVLGATRNDDTWFIDPFHGGEVLRREQCRRRIAEVCGRSDWPPDCLRPASETEIAVRVLRNLKVATTQAGQWQRAVPVQRRLTLLLPEQADERRDLGLILLQAGRPAEAILQLERYAALGPEAEEQIRPAVRTARQLLAEMN